MDSINYSAKCMILCMTLLPMSACSIEGEKPGEEKNGQENKGTYIIDHSFHACACEELCLDLYKEIVHDIEGKQYYVIEPLTNEPVDAGALVVGVSFMGKETDRDSDLEKLITRNVYTLIGPPPGGETGTYERFTYHSEAIKDISITSSSALFGRAPGERFDDLWELRRRKFVITDNQYQAINDNTSLGDYVKFEPMPDNTTYFKLKSVPVELPARLNIIFEITFTSGRILSKSVEVSLI